VEISPNLVTVLVELKLLAADTDLRMTADLSASVDGRDLSDMVPWRQFHESDFARIYGQSLIRLNLSVHRKMWLLMVVRSNTARKKGC
jgi:hypothetical protein